MDSKPKTDSEDLGLKTVNFRFTVKTTRKRASELIQDLLESDEVVFISLDYNSPKSVI